MVRSIAFSLALIICAVAPAAGQEAVPTPARPYDGIQAGLDAFRLAEEQRQANVGWQLGLNEQLRYWPVAPVFGGTTILYSPFAFVGPATFARQPIGQRQEQTGPNRWESHPVYSPPLTPFLPLPPVASHWLDRTPYAAAQTPVIPSPPEVQPRTKPSLLREVEIIPPPPPLPDPPRRGPREY